MQDAFVHCENAVREADKDRYLAALFAPADARRGLFALFAFDAEVAAIRERIRQPLAGEIRLQWWRDALVDPAKVEARSHPTASALLETIARHDLSVERLLELLDARTFDFYDEPMPTAEALERYCDAVVGAIYELAAVILGRGPDPALSLLARHAGIADGITRALQALGSDLSNGKVLVPEEVLQRHGGTVAHLTAGERSPAVTTALADLRGLARGHWGQARMMVGEITGPARAAFLTLALVPLYLSRLDQAANPFAPVAVPQWRRQWALWRAARRG
jgi:phytoene synthase